MFGFTEQPARKARLLRLGVSGAAALATAVALVAPAIPAHATANATASRLGGVDRYDTARLVAEAKFNTASGVPSVVLASGLNFPDALAGAYIAGLGVTNLATGPGGILLTNPQTASAPMLRALQELKVKNVEILGGTNAVSQAIQTQLSNTASTNSAGGNLNVTRTGGATRYDTMQMLDTEFTPSSVGNVGGKRTAIIASGANFPDALSASALSYKGQLPVVLTDPNTLSSQASQTLTSLGIQQVLIAGGTAAVSQADETAINNMGIPTLKRFSGVNRGDTAAQIATWETSAGSGMGFSNNEVTLARGDDFADALSGAQYAGDPKPILLTDTPTQLNSYTTTYLQTFASVINKITVFGGPAAIVDSVVNAALQAAGCTSNCTVNNNGTGNGNGNGTGTGQGATTSHPNSSAPDLISAGIFGSNNFANGQPTTAKFTFDKSITGVVTSLGFHLLTYSGTVYTPAAATCFVDGDGVSVDCPFGAGTNVATATIASVDSGTVNGSGGLNPMGSQPFGGFNSSTGASGVNTNGFPGPVLVSAAPVTGSNTLVTYTFNQNVTTPDGTKFGYNDVNGGQVAGLAGATASGPTVTVTFAAGTTPAPSQAVRFFNVDGAVTSNTAPPIPAAAGDVGAAIATRPNIVSIARTSTANQFLYTFDKAGTASVPADFELYRSDTGAVANGTAVAAQSNTQFIVTFGAPGCVASPTCITTTTSGLYSYGSVINTPTAGGTAGAVIGNGTPALPNTVGDVPVGSGTGSGSGAGTFSGPVLQSASGQVSTNQVVYTFDRAVTAPLATAFFVINPGGTATYGASVISFSGSTVTIGFGGTSIAGIVGAGVNGSGTWQTVTSQGIQNTPVGGTAGPGAKDTAAGGGNGNAPGDVSASSS